MFGNGWAFCSLILLTFFCNQYRTLFVPSFFGTVTIGLAKGNVEGWITPASNMSWMCFSIKWRCKYGTRYGFCLIGLWSPVLIRIWTRSVPPNWQSVSANMKGHWSTTFLMAVHCSSLTPTGCCNVSDLRWPSPAEPCSRLPWDSSATSITSMALRTWSSRCSAAAMIVAEGRRMWDSEQLLMGTIAISSRLFNCTNVFSTFSPAQVKKMIERLGVAAT